MIALLLLLLAVVLCALAAFGIGGTGSNNEGNWGSRFSLGWAGVACLAGALALGVFEALPK